MAPLLKSSANDHRKATRELSERFKRGFSVKLCVHPVVVRERERTSK